MTDTDNIRWCRLHDEPARRLANYCVLGLRRSEEATPCEVESIPEESIRCVGGCGRHTLGTFESGTHGPGHYCGWCQAIPDVAPLVENVPA